MYFKRFPAIHYPVVINGTEQYKVLKDLTINVRFVKEFLSNITLYDLYDIVDGETPEIISEKFYGTPLYHWVIMIMNERYDYLNDFPLPYNILRDCAIEKYGEDGINDTHHHENANGYVVSSDTPLARVVTNIEYEESVNESKRTIKIIDREIIQKVVNDFVKLVS